MWFHDHLSVFLGAVFALSVIHVLDERFAGVGFVARVRSHWRPGYLSRLFWRLNIALLLCLALSFFLFWRWGGNWVALPLFWTFERVAHGVFFHGASSIRYREHVPGTISGVLFVPLALAVWSANPLAWNRFSTGFAFLGLVVGIANALVPASLKIAVLGGARPPSSTHVGSEHKRLLFSSAWFCCLVLIQLAPRVLPKSVPMGFSMGDISALFSVLATILFIALMYALSAGRKLMTSLSAHTDWERLRDVSPSNTLAFIGYCSLALMIVVVSSQYFIRTSTAPTIPVSRYQQLAAQLIFWLCFFSFCPVLVAFNAFDALANNPSWSNSNRLRLRRLGWGGYLLSLHLFAIVLLLVASVFAPTLSALLCFLYWGAAVYYYHCVEEYTYEFTTDSNLLRAYGMLRYRLFTYGYMGQTEVRGRTLVDADEFDGKSETVVIRHELNVFGGARLTVHEPGTDSTLPSENPDFNIASFLNRPELLQMRYAEVSRLGVESLFRKAEHLRNLFRAIYNRCRDAQVDYVFAIAPAPQVRLYRKAGFEQLSEQAMPEQKKHAGLKMFLVCLDLTNVVRVQEFDRSYRAGRA